MVDQHPPHHLRRDRIEVHAVVPVQLFSTAEPEVDLVDQRGGLQRMAMALAAQVPASNLSQLAINQRQQSLGSRLVPLLPAPKQLGDVLGGGPSHGLPLVRLQGLPPRPGPGAGRGQPPLRAAAGGPLRATYALSPVAVLGRLSAAIARTLPPPPPATVLFGRRSLEQVIGSSR